MSGQQHSGQGQGGGRGVERQGGRSQDKESRVWRREAVRCRLCRWWYSIDAYRCHIYFISMDPTSRGSYEGCAEAHCFLDCQLSVQCVQPVPLHADATTRPCQLKPLDVSFACPLLPVTRPHCGRAVAQALHEDGGGGYERRLGDGARLTCTVIREAVASPSHTSPAPGSQEMALRTFSR